jgi:hypothetical protein
VPERDRDQSVERLLPRLMSDDVTRLQGTCVDSEKLAAWSEGFLRGAEASAVERHVADCARCRALMASIVRTTPPVPVAESLWRRWHLAWAVPLATAATAAGIWVALPDNGAAPLTPAQETNMLARDERRASPSEAPAAESIPAPSPPAASASAIRPQEEKARPAESTNNEVRQRTDRRASRELADLQSRAASPPVPQAEGRAPVGPAPPAAPVAAPTPAGAAAERAEADSKSQVAANSGLAPLVAARRAFAPNQIVSADGTTRWRIVNGQQVERSMNAGATWTPAAITSTDALSAAAAPSATVCWIVGARGAVYVTTDGTRFVRVPFPEIIDLTSVSATDGLAAAVSSADGRLWRTTDQGKTWSISR